MSFVYRHRVGLLAAGWLCLAAYAADPDFVSAVEATHPLTFYRLDGPSGKSEVGSTTYKATGGVTSGDPGAPVQGAAHHFAAMNGKDGFLTTTQAGGIAAAASMMAWVNMDSLPSKTGHFFYVMGESEYGNDLDLQFENDDALRFYTAGGSNLSYKPDRASLVHQWHMIVVTMDTAAHTRVMYWDGKQVGADKDAGRAGKRSVFSIGASTVFRGRFFNGGIEEVALWNRALAAREVAAIYAAAQASAGAGGGTTVSGGRSPGGAVGGGSAGEALGGTLFPTSATVEAEDSKGPLALKGEEKIALMFLTATQNLERDCQMKTQRACTMEEVLQKLKYDPRKDPNYAYTLAASGIAWEAHANAKKPGLRGFCFQGRMMGTSDAYYNASGTASTIDTQITGRSVVGDAFNR